MITQETSRAYGSCNQGCILEEVYTKIINLFSKFTPPSNVVLFPEISASDENIEKRGAFSIIARFHIGDLNFEALEGLGGHMHGEVFYLCPEEGLIFPEDAVINFKSLSSDRTEYNLLADYLMTSVNVDSKLAREELNALHSLISEIDERLTGKGKKCLICCGHGSVSVLEDGKLINTQSQRDTLQSKKYFYLSRKFLRRELR